MGFGSVRLIRTQTGVVIGMAQVLLPFMILPLYSVMRGIDLRLMQAAQSLGARPVRAFLTVYLPLSLPGVYAGAIIVFILALGFYITPGPARRAALDHAFDAGAEPGAEPAPMGPRRRHGRGALARNLPASGVGRTGDAPEATRTARGTDGDEAAHPRPARRLPACSSQSGWWRRRSSSCRCRSTGTSRWHFRRKAFPGSGIANFVTNPEWSTSFFNSLKVAVHRRRAGDSARHAGRLRAGPDEGTLRPASCACSC